MRCTSFLLLLCIQNCIVLVFTECVVSKHNRGTFAASKYVEYSQSLRRLRNIPKLGFFNTAQIVFCKTEFADRLQCSNVTLATVSNQNTTDVLTIMLLNSNVRYIPKGVFLRYARTLQSLNINSCDVVDIDPAAFEGLASLKKLSLSNNKITQVKEEWFKDTVYLEQLDLSFNQITKLEPVIFSKLLLLKRLDIKDNFLTCFDPSALPGGIDKVHFSGNPLAFKCRAKLTLWMRDHGVSYKTEQSEKEAWLDKLLWLCAMDDASIAESEVLMKECIILNLFNQLRTGLSTAESYPLSVPQQCVNARNLLTSCIVDQTQKFQTFTNGNVIKNLLLYLYQARSSI